MLPLAMHLEIFVYLVRRSLGENLICTIQRESSFTDRADPCNWPLRLLVENRSWRTGIAIVSHWAVTFASTVDSKLHHYRRCVAPPCSRHRLRAIPETQRDPRPHLIWPNFQATLLGSARNQEPPVPVLRIVATATPRMAGNAAAKQ